MKFGLDIPTTGEFADPRLLAQLAQAAEEAGGDGFFVWDVLVQAHRTEEGPFEVVMSGESAADRSAARAQVQAFADAGAPWWVEDGVG